jgi:hypothetical protein
MIHVSALLRWNKPVLGRWKRAYRPKNLASGLKAVVRTYGNGPDYVPIVDWNGSLLDPAKPNEKAIAVKYLQSAGLL